MFLIAWWFVIIFYTGNILRNVIFSRQEQETKPERKSLLDTTGPIGRDAAQTGKLY